MITKMVTNLITKPSAARFYKASSSVSTEEEVSELKLKLDKDAAISVGKIVGVVVLVIIGLALLPTVQDSVYTATQNENTTDTQESLLNLVTLFYILAIMLAVIAWVVIEAKFGKGG